MEPPRSGSVTNEAHAEAPLLGKRVLLAEDDAIARKLVARALADMGAEVIETADGGRMLVAIASHYKDGRSPTDLDLIVTDIRMPVVGGLEVFQGLRAAGWTTPVIVVTGYDAADVRDAADRLGAVILSKPLDLEELERAVRTLITAPRRTTRGPARVPRPRGGRPR